MRIARYSLGLEEESGVLIAGSQRPDFPTETEALVLRVAANQAAIALENARLFALAQRERAGAESAQQQVASILESITDSFAVYDRDWRITYLNKEAEKLLPRLGLTPEGVRGKIIWELFPSLVGTDIYEQYHRAVKEQVPVQFELFFEPLNEWYELRAYPSKDGLAVYSQNITERKKLLASEQAARAEAERRWRESQLLAEATRRFSATLQLQELMPAICRAAREIAGSDGATMVLREGDQVHYAEEDAIEPLWKGQRFPITMCISGRAILEHKPAIVEDISTDERLPIESYQSTFVKSLLMVPVPSHNPLGAIGVYWARQHRPDEREVALLETLADSAHLALINTQLYEQTRASREQAEEANRLKDEFLATVSHELRTPLNAMLGWTRILRNGNLNQETVERALEIVERNARSQAQLVEDLLDVSRIISGQMPLNVQPVDLGTVIQAAIDSVRLAAEAKSIRFTTILDPLAGPVSGDPTRLQQIIWNLLSNAIKFTPKDGTVRVQLARNNSHLEVTIADNGVGISAEFLPHVFDRFRQADSTLTRLQGGLGLGLAIVRHLVELHGANVEAHSAGIGKGATFTIRFPLMAVREVDAFPAEVAARRSPIPWPDIPFECPPGLKDLRVLVVDDDPDARQLLTLLLERCQARVITANSVAEAIERFEKARPDILVSDIEMPGEDGYSCIRKIRAKEGKLNGRIPAAALTAHAGVTDRMRALAAGFDIHVPKPVEPAEFVAVIASLASRISKR
ncbi:MAG: ATP-binding protein [Acidobacteriota bacterium]